MFLVGLDTGCIQESSSTNSNCIYIGEVSFWKQRSTNEIVLGQDGYWIR